MPINRPPHWPRHNFRTIFLVVVVFLLFSLSWQVVLFVTDWLWFQEVGYRTVFSVMLTAQFQAAALFGAAFFLLLAGNLLLALRLSETGPVVQEDIIDIPEMKPGNPRIYRLALALAVILSVFSAVQGSSQWENWLRFLNATPFGLTDPIFQRDIGFYVFSLPFLRHVYGWVMSVLTLTLAATAVVYLLRRSFLLVLRPPRFDFRLAPAARAHLLIILAVLFLLGACGFWLDLSDLLYVKRGVVYGAGYTDTTTQVWILQALMGLSLLTGAAFGVFAFRRDWRLPALAVLVFLAVLLIGRSFYPTFVQKFKVVPNEVVLEKPYLERNIRYTRLAYGLQDIEDREFPADDNLTLRDIRRNDTTIKNVRLWDHAPLLQTYSQLQEIRTYYKFLDVDNDRYVVNGEYRQIMISPRELSYSALPSRTWVNEHLTYTHGYGVVMGPVNRISREGLPEFFIKDIPPVSSAGIKVTRPEIYYGDTSNEYVFVRTKRPEFDYPVGDKNVYSRYEGTGGVPLSFWKKVLFAMRFGSLTILLSDDINEGSRIMYYRTVRERIARILPFVRLDSDPYLVISPEGRLLWFIDGYTVTDRYPYSEPMPKVGNYIRNTVKAVMDAYDGSVQIYISDPKDPIIRTYDRIFPGVFKKIETMPEALRSHVRYPPGLLMIQARMYRAYHMQDPQVFYNKEDLWTIPRMTAAGGEQEMEPYYTIMKLPDEKRDEFILMLPFTPSRKDNMSAWMAARCDAPHYGKVIVYNFPKQRLVYGPRQIEARINQDPGISQQLSLWNQRGSQVIHGSLLAVPIEKSILYVQPLYLAAEKGQLPELKRVIAAFGNTIAMDENLEQALQRVFGGEVSRERAESTTGLAGPPVADKTKVQLAAEALSHYRKAQEYLRQGNWAGYGEEMKKMEAVLANMAR